MQNTKKSQKSILIIENEVLHQKIFQNLLGKQYTLHLARTLGEATALLISAEPDLMMMDIHVDGYDGRSCLEYPNLKIPVLATSASVDLSADNFRELGFSGFIKKPAAAKELYRILAQTLADTPEQLKPRDNLPTFDQAVLRELLKFNSEQKLKKIIADFIEEAHGILSALEEELPHEDSNIIRENLHTLLGNSGTLGAKRLHFLATEAQKLARDADFEGVARFLREMQTEVAQIEKAIITPLIVE